MAEIKVLSDKEQARDRINVWHGSATYHMNMIKELIGNSLDVFDPNILNTITIKMHNNGKIEYIDSGKGIPVEGIASDGRPNAEAIFEKAFAGSKYNNQADTVGQNGIFLWTLSMTSQDIEYFIARPDANIYNIAYHKGDRVKDLSIIGNSDKTYSKIIFELDTDVWENPIFDYEEICSIAKAQSSLGNVKIIVENLETNEKQEFYYENGIEGYFDDITSTKSIVTDKIKIQKSLQFKIKHNGIDKEDSIKVNLIFAYSNDSEEDKQREFLNTADLIEHGTIQDGIIAGLKNSVNKWLKDNGKYNKNEKQISNDDIITGLNYVCDVRSLLVEYENQTKKKTRAYHYKPVMQQIIEEFMEVYFTENKEETNKLCNQILLNKRIREKSEVSRKKVQKELSEKINNSTTRPEKLIPCRSKNPNEIELILIEGDSAKNSVTLSRNSKTQAIFPLKGKPLNCVKKSIDAIINNEEIKNVFKILGCGVTYKGKQIKGLPKFDMSNLQYDKLIIFTDEDEDGFHIRTLLLGVFYILAPQLIENGHIYILESPLYRIKCKGKTYLAYDEFEKNKILKELNAKTNITRFKGLGGLNADMLSETAMSEKNRKLIQVTLKDVEESIETLEMFLDDNSKPRKEYISINGDKYFDYSIYED